MPIRFRCSGCKKLLGIATRKAGSYTVCPHCAEIVTVPTKSDEHSGDLEQGGDEPIDLSDIDEVLNGAAAAPANPTAARPARPQQPPPRLAPNVELVQTYNPQPVRPAPPLPAPPAASREPPAAHNPGQLVLSVQRAMVVVALVAVLLFVAFVAGYMVGKR